MLDIVFYTEGLPFDGMTPFERSLGGSESAVVFMARELARRGHKVRVFCPCERPGRYEGVDYEDLTEWPEFAELRTCDVFVCTRHLRGLTAPLTEQLEAQMQAAQSAGESFSRVVQNHLAHVTEALGKFESTLCYSVEDQKRWQDRLLTTLDRIADRMGGERKA